MSRYVPELFLAAGNYITASLHYKGWSTLIASESYRISLNSITSTYQYRTVNASPLIKLKYPWRQ